MICFAWSGFPQYAARCVGAFVHATGQKAAVVATRPGVPVEGMENACGCPVYWVEHSDTRDLRDVLGGMPRVLFVSGWGIPLFNRYRDEVRKAGCRVIAMCDNNFIFSFREVAKALRFRLLLRGKYDGYLVPGISSTRLLRFYGVASSRIKSGLYAADERLFNGGGIEINDRPKRIVFVGQFCARKNPLRMCEAFRQACGAKKGWTLALYGCGPIPLASDGDSAIEVHDFLQPEQLSQVYREARVFCLPSIEEHWGVVVHEAAMSGCALLLSDQVGAAVDFMVPGENGYLFNPWEMNQMMQAFSAVMTWTEDALESASRISRSRAMSIGLKTFVQAVVSLCEMQS